MQRFEYKVVPAPDKGKSARGVKGTANRFALQLSDMMNDLAREGWEYLRADTLPCQTRSGLGSKTTQFENMLIFRRALAQDHAPLPLKTPETGEEPDPQVDTGEDAASTIRTLKATRPDKDGGRD